MNNKKILFVALTTEIDTLARHPANAKKYEEFQEEVAEYIRAGYVICGSGEYIHPRDGLRRLFIHFYLPQDAAK